MNCMYLRIIHLHVGIQCTTVVFIGRRQSTAAYKNSGVGEAACKGTRDKSGATQDAQGSAMHAEGHSDLFRSRGNKPNIKCCAGTYASIL